MREIKFRAWDGKEMVLHNSLYEFQCQNLTKKEMEGVVYLQYTGMKDKNGKEVYEGDVVLADRPHEDWEEPDDVEKVYAVVVYNSPSFYAKYLNEDLNKFVSGQNGFILRPYNTVIGNIYQNPELIK